MLNTHESLAGMRRVDRTPNLGLDFSPILNRFVDTQRLLTADATVVLSENPSRKALLDFYKKTDLFKQTYAYAAKYALNPSVLAQDQDLRSDFVGKVFSDLAFIWLNFSLPSNQTILSQDQTLVLWSKMYPHVQRIEHPFGTASLAGITVPDGVVVERNGDKPRIVRVCEYKTNGNRVNRGGSYNGYVIGKEIFPVVLGEADFKFFVPDDSSSPSRSREFENDIVRLTISYSQLRNFLDDTLGIYRPTEESATINELEARKTEQVSGVKTINPDGSQADFVKTPEYKRYVNRAYLV